jgi:ribosomal protein L11 methyltransferase
MSWWVIEVSCPELVDPELVATALVEATGQTVEERPALVVGYAAEESTAREAADLMASRFTGVTVRVDPAAPVDWTSRWKDGLAVREIGRLRVGPSWLLAPGPGAIVIDPETAFGTGEHGSTRGALSLLERHLAPGDRVLDLGSGSGVLSIGAVRLGAARALGIEIDAEAVPVARANAAANGVADRVEFTEGDAGLLAPLAAPVDVVVSNILRSVNLGLLEPIGRALRPGGLAIFAGMEAPEAPLFRPPLVTAGFVPFDEAVDENWWSVAARRR